MGSKVIVLCFGGVLATAISMITFASSQGIDTWLREGHRLPNIRLVDEGCRPWLVEHFLALQDWSQPTMLALGDSQVFANGVASNDAWPAELAQHLGTNIVNASILDGRPGDTAAVAAAASRLGLRVDSAIVNLNQSHFSPAVIDVRHLDSVEPGPFDRLKCAYRLRRQAFEGPLPFPEDAPTAQGFHYHDLDPDYFVADLPRAVEMLAPMLHTLSAVSETSIALVTPNDVARFPGFAQRGLAFDLDGYRALSASLQQACEESATDWCLNLSEALPDAAFSDIVHLNVGGHSSLAKLIYAQLAPRPDSPENRR